MPEELTVEQTIDTAQEPITNLSQQLQNAMWGDITPTQQQPPVQEDAKVEDVKTVEPLKKEEEILDHKDWLKREFNIEDVDVLKSRMTEYETLKNQKPEEVKFANDYSKQAYDYLLEGKLPELYKHLDKKMKLSGSENLSAVDAIKLSIAFKNEHYSKEDIEDVYSENYSLPKEPKQLATESDEEFEERKTDWNQQVERVKRRIERDAIAAKQDLSKLNSELVLPNISPKQESKTQPLSKEDLEKEAKFKDDFLASVTSSLKDFTGFSTQVKDKDVELSVSYGLSPEETSFIDKKMKLFAESGFNANALFAEDWVNEDGKVNTKKMTEDLSKIYFFDKASSKFANDSAAQRLEIFLKEKKNIKINEPGHTNIPDASKTESQRLQEAFWGN